MEKTSFYFVKKRVSYYIAYNLNINLIKVDYIAINVKVSSSYHKNNIIHT